MSNNKINSMLRLLAMTLAFVMLCCCGAGCSSSDDEYSEFTSVITTIVDDGTTESGDANSGTASTGSSNPSQATTGGNNSTTGGGSTSTGGSGGSSANLDGVTTKGKTFTILSALLPTKESSDNYLFEQMFFKRVREVEKEYGCTIKVINTMLPNASNLAPLIRAGKPVANVIEVELRDLPSMVAAGYVIPWTSVPGINVNDSKYTASYTKIAAYSGEYYGLNYMKPPEVRYCVVMNKNLLKAANIDADGIYDLIKQKKWNFSTFLDYATKAQKAANKSGTVYGVGGDPDYFMEMILAANNANIVTMNNGKATPTYTDNKVVEALTFMDKLINTDKVYMINSQMNKSSTYISGKPNYIDQFIKGNLAFLFEDSWVLEQQIRPKVKSFDYGMINIPMGPSATDYASPSGHARVFVVTSTNKELEFTSKIFNALAEQPKGYSGDDWWKEEVQLSYFQKDDTKSLEVYLKTLESVSFDPGVGMDSVFDTFLNKAMRDPIFFGKGTPAAAVKSLEGTLDPSINNLFNKK